MARAPGFSLVECVMATLVLSAGVLSVVASATATQRLSQLGRHMSGAAEVAASRLDALRASACRSPADGNATGFYQERWSVTASGPVRAVRLDIAFVAGLRPRTIRFDATFLCAPP